MTPSWTRLPDLASRAAGGTVAWANDELFAERENLITRAEPGYRPATFGHKGQVYDGWETRRRREPGDDSAIVRLGLPGVIRGVVVDTAFFKGNYPPAATVEATRAPGHPSPDELTGWEVVVPRSPLEGDRKHHFDVAVEKRFTHVRLTIHPDGGVARLRVYGSPVPDPDLLVPEAVDLAALENGASVTGCSNTFYSDPANLIAPGPAAVMGEGWETARRRDDGNDWVELALAAPGAVRLAELDTSHFKGNAPGWASVRVRDERTGGDWVDLLPRTRLQPDTRHRFRVTGPEATHARLDIYPDGGMARLRLVGALTPSGLETITQRFRVLTR
ncbi:allantoicase [Actinosynnema sp. NPDC047251]|uniref:Probable allantoicase n=1 Tax=Saccharothrix espanaensis (strain ATCC 51144 / DSM 44229 / JCM 9112 / NBRC 15066 / NRRL 15764) TaxID=1179773 RepID=K0KCL4_SACES|nr:allantoicase [Saccharothrix espanaensis]CCH34348.1 putative allantoicase [Saccharothrix espanaensis DSM 44229]